MKAILVALGLALLPIGGAAEAIRIATYNAELERDGPGLLLRDLRRGDDPDIEAAIAVIAAAAPDILALQGIDYDAGNAALDAFSTELAAAGVDYPHRFALPPNRGVATGLDLDGDGKRGEPSDAQGYGRFAGAGGMAVLSRFPIQQGEVQDFSTLLWRDLPGATLPTHPDGRPFPTDAAQAVQRLSDSGHWIVPIVLPGGAVIELATWHAAPPVFDGPEDRNGLRNRDEARLWTLWLDGQVGRPADGYVVLAGSATMDPEDSEGRADALRALLDDPRLQDPRPESEGGAAARDQGHRTSNALDTVDWPAPGPGRLRVDYVLPDRRLEVETSGVWWPAKDQPGHDTALAASRHRLVWVDILLPE